MWFWRVLETGWNSDVFWDLPWEPQDPGDMELEGKKVDPWALTAIPFGLIQDSYMQQLPEGIP